MTTYAIIMLLMAPVNAWCEPGGYCELYAEYTADAINQASEATGLDRMVLINIHYNENRFDPTRRAEKGAGPVGLNPRAQWGRLAKLQCSVDGERCIHAHVLIGAWLVKEEWRRCRSFMGGIGAYGSGKCEGAGHEKAKRTYRWARAEVRRMLK